MSFNSKQYLTHAENIATGTVIATGTYRRYQESTAMADRNAWFASLSDAQREELRREAEYEQSKLKYTS
jgi:hypothetical protein